MQRHGQQTFFGKIAKRVGVERQGYLLRIRALGNGHAGNPDESPIFECRNMTNKIFHIGSLTYPSREKSYDLMINSSEAGKQVHSPQPFRCAGLSNVTYQPLR